MLSSHGTGTRRRGAAGRPRRWSGPLGRPSLEGTGQRRLEGRAVGEHDEVLEGMALDQGLVVPEHPSDGRRHRLHDPVAVEQQQDAGRVVHQGPEPFDVIGGQLPAASFGEVPQTPDESVDRRPSHEVGADQLDQLPPRRGLHAELDRRADALLAHAQERGDGQLDVLGVQELQSARPHDVRVGEPEEPFCRRIAPDQVALGVGHDDGIGQLQSQMLQPRRFHCPFPKAAPEASALGDGT